MKQTIFFYLFLSLPASVSGESLPSFEACLPPIGANDQEAGECSLTYQPPPLLRQAIKVDDCSFQPGQAVAKGTGYKFLYCSAFNDTDEPIESIQYGIRYFETGESTPLTEAGFGQTHIFRTANITGHLKPGETRQLGFVGPAIPIDSDALTLDIQIEVLGVYVPGSRAIR